MNEIKYIPEQKAFLINGKLIKEETLTQQEISNLMENCTGNLTLLTGNEKSNISNNTHLLI